MAEACQRARSRAADTSRRPARQAQLTASKRQSRASARKPEPQADPSLPPFGELVADHDGSRLQCHVCGRFLAGLNHHARLAHGMSADWYREIYRLPRTLSLSSPAVQANLRAAALARNQGEVGRANIPSGAHRPKGIPNQLISRQRMSAASESPSPEPLPRTSLWLAWGDPADPAWAATISQWPDFGDCGACGWPMVRPGTICSRQPCRGISQQRAARRWDAEHPEYAPERNRTYRAAHLEDLREKERLRKREYSESHRREEQNRSRAYREAHREQERERHASYRQRKKEGTE